MVQVTARPPDTARPPATAPADDAPAPTGASLRLGIPFVGVHVAVLAVAVVGWSPTAVGVAVALYLARAFGITAFYHRLLTHRAFRTGRWVQLAGTVLAAAAAQRGPLWWVGHHRIHHRLTEQHGDPHSPRVMGFWRAHVGWQFDRANDATPLTAVRDLADLPEMRFLDRYHHVVPVTLAATCFLAGWGLGHLRPGLTDGPQLLVWGFCVSTVALWHATFAVNSFAHRFGRRPNDTDDDSTNNPIVALLTLGEGWHNNHHRAPRAARHGWGRGQVDPTWRLLWVMERLGLVRDLRPAPATVRG